MRRHGAGSVVGQGDAEGVEQPTEHYFGVEVLPGKFERSTACAGVICLNRLDRRDRVVDRRE